MLSHLLKQRWDYLPQVCVVRGVRGDNQVRHALFTTSNEKHHKLGLKVQEPLSKAGKKGNENQPAYVTTESNR